MSNSCGIGQVIHSKRDFPRAPIRGTYQPTSGLRTPLMRGGNGVARQTRPWHGASRRHTTGKVGTALTPPPLPLEERNTRSDQVRVTGHPRSRISLDLGGGSILSLSAEFVGNVESDVVSVGWRGGGENGVYKSGVVPRLGGGGPFLAVGIFFSSIRRDRRLCSPTLRRSRHGRAEVPPVRRRIRALSLDAPLPTGPRRLHGTRLTPWPRVNRSTQAPPRCHSLQSPIGFQ